MKELIKERGKYLTKNLVPGTQVYGEKIVRMRGEEYRQWNPWRSKIGAALKKGLTDLPIKENTNILYLGSATGTTVSHLSDIITKGKIYCVEISEKSMQKLLEITDERKNIYPILKSANAIEEYSFVKEVEVIVQDVAQKNQTEIFIKNVDAYLKNKGIGLLALKTKSISQSKSYNQIVDEELTKLKQKYKIKQVIDLTPYEKEHAFIVIEKQ